MRPSLRNMLLYNTSPVASPLLLNIITGASAAYSLARKLNSNYTGYAFQVTRSNDSASLNIGFLSSGLVNIAAAQAFVGSNTGYVTALYDQAGANNFTQSTLAKAPILINSGALQTQNSQPAMLYNTSGQLLSCANPITNNMGTFDTSILAIFYPLASAVEASTSGRLYELYHNSDQHFIAIQNSTAQITSTFNATGTNGQNYSGALTYHTQYMMLETRQLSTTYTNYYLNNVLSGAANQQLNFTSQAGQPCSLGGSSGASKTYSGYMQEFIVWNTLVNYAQVGAWYNTFYGV